MCIAEEGKQILMLQRCDILSYTQKQLNQNHNKYSITVKTLKTLKTQQTVWPRHSSGVAYSDSIWISYYWLALGPNSLLSFNVYTVIEYLLY